MLKALSLDQAVNSGWAVGTDRDPKGFTFGRWSMPKRPTHERLNWLLNQIIQKAEAEEVNYLFYEAPWMPNDEQKKSMWATIVWGLHIEATVMIAAARLAIPVESYRSQSWRKTICGVGRPDEPKKAVMNRCRALGYDVKNSDEGDAIGIAFHGLFGPPASARVQGNLLEMAGADL